MAPGATFEVAASFTSYSSSLVTVFRVDATHPLQPPALSLDLSWKSRKLPWRNVQAHTTTRVPQMKAFCPKDPGADFTPQVFIRGKCPGTSIHLFDFYTLLSILL